MLSLHTIDLLSISHTRRVLGQQPNNSQNCQFSIGAVDMPAPTVESDVLSHAGAVNRMHHLQRVHVCMCAHAWGHRWAFDRTQTFQTPPPING